MGVLFRQVLLSLIVSFKTGLYYASLGAFAFLFVSSSCCMFSLVVFFVDCVVCLWIVVRFCLLLLRVSIEWVSLGCILGCVV